VGKGEFFTVVHEPSRSITPKAVSRRFMSVFELRSEATISRTGDQELHRLPIIWTPQGHLVLGPPEIRRFGGQDHHQMVEMQPSGQA
jgi:hypothetical protein